MTVEAEVSGRRYVEDRDTAAVCAAPRTARPRSPSAGRWRSTATPRRPGGSPPRARRPRPRGGGCAGVERQLGLETENCRLEHGTHAPPPARAPQSRRRRSLPRPRRLPKSGRRPCSSPSRTSRRGATARCSTRSARAFGGHAALLDVHADADHHRAVFTLAGEPGALARGRAQRGARGGRADRSARARGRAPARRRGRRRADRVPRRGRPRRRVRRGALLADAIGRELGAPRVPLRRARRRAHPRRAAPGGPAGLDRRGDAPDYGPRAAAPDRRRHARRRAAAAGRLQRGARAPPATLADARAIAARSARAAPRGCPASARSAALQLARRRPGLDQHRGPHARDRAPTWSPRSAATPR